MYANSIIEYRRHGRVLSIDIQDCSLFGFDRINIIVKNDLGERFH